MRKLIVIAMIFLLTGCGSVSGDFGNKTKLLTKMESLVKDKKYDEAYFEFRKYYKDNKKKPTQEEIKYYNEVTLMVSAKDINEFLTSDKELTLHKYISDETNKEINEIANKKISKLKEGLKKAIDNKDDNKIRTFFNTEGLQNKDQEFRAMIAYGSFIVGNDSSPNMARARIFDSVPPDYNGEYSSQIREIADKTYIDDSEWLKDYNQVNHIYTETKNVEIGMTEDEVITQTDWGKPTDINTTITGSTKSE